MLERILLSVSSVGSWALQQQLMPWGSLLSLSFSILSRIVGAATSGRKSSLRRPVLALSVSSVGSWALQPGRGRGVWRGFNAFSILSRIVGAATSSVLRERR